MFGRLLKEYRMNLHYTQETMAAELGISTNHLSRIELGKTQPSGQLIEKILEIFAQDARVLSMDFQCDELYGIVFLAKMNQLDQAARNVVFNNAMQLMNWMLKQNTKQ